MYIYTIGRPHVGSTILDIMLGNSPDVVSVGELVHVRKAHGMCGCGVPIGDCPFWKRVREMVEARGFPWAEMTEAAYRQAHIRNFLRTWFAHPDDPELRRLEKFTSALDDIICHLENAKYLLDSTKEITRGLFAIRFVPGTRIVHLVRDPRGVVSGHYWRWKKNQYFFFLRKKRRSKWLGPFFMMLAAASWTVGNLLAELVIRRAFGRVVRIRYEDLCRDPAAELQRVGHAFNINVEAVITRLHSGMPLAVGHNVGGNQIRFERNLRFDPNREHRRPQLPVWLRITIIAMCWPLMLAYGYPLSASKAPYRRAPQSA